MPKHKCMCFATETRLGPLCPELGTGHLDYLNASIGGGCFMSWPFKILGAVAYTVALTSNGNAQGLVSQKNIPLAMAKTIAEAAMDKCQECKS